LRATPETTAGYYFRFAAAMHSNKVQKDWAAVGLVETIEQCCRIIAEISAEIQYGLISIQLDSHPTDFAHSYISSSSNNNSSFKAVRCMHIAMEALKGHARVLFY